MGNFDSGTTKAKVHEIDGSAQERMLRLRRAIADSATRTREPVDPRDIPLARDVPLTRGMPVPRVPAYEIYERQREMAMVMRKRSIGTHAHTSADAGAGANGSDDRG